MKKVLNEKNAAALQKLGDYLVAPLVALLGSAKREATTLTNCYAFKTLPPEKAKVVSIALKQVVAKNNFTLEDACNVVLRDSSVAEMGALGVTFHYQAYQLSRGNYSLPVVKLKNSVKMLFADYLYGVLFDNAEIWRALTLPQLRRESFHDNFRIDNDHPAACPYCDLDTINSRGSVKVEHFLPKSKFPLLSVHPLNLLSACESCNSGGFGKGSRVANELVCPYFEAISDSVIFDFDQISKTMEIDAHYGKAEVTGFLNLLNLKLRYRESNVGIQFYRRMDAFISAMISCKPGDELEIRRYLEKSQAGAPLTVALCYWLENIYIPAQSLSIT
ncbi:hypothetical protein [Caballeronia sp. DA-9]|uniref:hypothetical protein n=1 Tax=Caballeronia sp. DA-9 TaxID=3436237 RepID=UPI003F67BFD0